MKIIGNLHPPEKRKRLWSDLIELKKSIETFKNCSSEHELAIASLDRRVYNYYLNDYVNTRQEASKVA